MFKLFLLFFFFVSGSTFLFEVFEVFVWHLVSSVSLGCSVFLFLVLIVASFSVRFLWCLCLVLSVCCFDWRCVLFLFSTQCFSFYSSVGCLFVV